MLRWVSWRSAAACSSNLQQNTRQKNRLLTSKAVPNRGLFIRIQIFYSTHHSKPKQIRRKYLVLLLLHPFNGLFSRTTWVSLWGVIQSNTNSLFYPTFKAKANTKETRSTTITTTPVFFSRKTWVRQYQASKTSPDLNEARGDGVCGWQLDHM